MERKVIIYDILMLVFVLATVVMSGLTLYTVKHGGVIRYLPAPTPSVVEATVTPDVSLAPSKAASPSVMLKKVK